MLKRDLFKLLLFVHQRTNVPRYSATLQEDVFTNQLSVMSFLEEHPTDVTQPAESANVSNHLVTIMTHVPLTLMLRELDARTLLNANPATFALLQNATRLQELAHLLTKTAMTVILVPLTLAAQSLELANTLQRLAHALLEMLDTVTPPPDNVHLLQHAEPHLTAQLDKLAALTEDVLSLNKIL